MSEVVEELGLDLDSSGSEKQRMLGAVSGAHFRPIIGQDGSFESFVRCFNKGASLSSRS